MDPITCAETSPPSPLDLAVEAAGGVGKLAELLTAEAGKPVRQNVVSNWRARGIPREWLPAIEHVTGVRCELSDESVSWVRVNGRVTHCVVPVAA